MAALTPFDPAGPLRTGPTLIEASAGTGKTHTITSLLLRLVLEEGLRIDQTLVVTFTEAATADLRDRVRQRLRDALRAFENEGEASAGDDELVRSLRSRSEGAGSLEADTRRLAAALRDFDEAMVSTIHGFCHRVLSEHAFELGAALGAELVPDEGPLLDEIVRDFWVRELHEAPPDAYQYLVARARAPSHLRLDLDRLDDLGRRVCAQREMLVLPSSPPSRMWSK